MINSLIISLVMAIVIELTISLIIGVRNKYDLLTIIFTNTLTNPLTVFTVNVINNSSLNINIWIVILILEVIVTIVEGKIYEKILRFKKISGFKLSFINNVLSFLIGVIYNIIK